MRSPSTFLPFTVLAAILCLGSLPHAAEQPATAPPSNRRHSPIVEVVRRARGAIVNIHSERSVRGADSNAPFALSPSQNRVNGMGTGIIIDPRGYIITNHHVIDDVNVIRVRTSDRASYSARILARDHETDLALLKIDAPKPLPTVTLGTAADLMVGETVIAIGNAFGYDDTVTVGIVSAIKRDVVLNKDVSYKSLIQTDASINPGNSGGPLLNINGELVGVNVAIRAGAQGIGFAIPVDHMIRSSAEMLSVRQRKGLSHGMVCRDRVEMNAAPLTRVEGPEGGTAEPAGWTRVTTLEKVEANGPAARGGLQRGDVVLRVGDQPIACSLDVERALLDHAAGDRVPVVVRRGNTEQRCEVVLQALERQGPAPAELVWRKLGMRVQPVNAEITTRVNPQLRGGLAVTEVRPESTAARAGIQQGDILVGLHQWEMLALDNVAFVVSHPDLATFSPLRFYIIRSGQVHRGWLQPLE
jgi:serine protease Do